jgi:HEAT repeat protein
MRHRRLYRLTLLIVSTSALLVSQPASQSQVVNTEARQRFPRLQSIDPSDREAATKEIGSELSSVLAVPILIELTGDSDRAVRLAAIDSLGKLGASSQLALPALAKCTQDPDDAIRKACVNSLGKIQLNNREMIASLNAVLKDRSRDVRLTAVDALFKTRADNELKIAGLVLALNDSDPEVRNVVSYEGEFN